MNTRWISAQPLVCVVEEMCEDFCLRLLSGLRGVRTRSSGRRLRRRLVWLIACSSLAPAVSHGADPDGLLVLGGGLREKTTSGAVGVYQRGQWTNMADLAGRRGLEGTGLPTCAKTGRAKRTCASYRSLELLLQIGADRFIVKRTRLVAPTGTNVAGTAGKKREILWEWLQPAAQRKVTRAYDLRRCGISLRRKSRSEATRSITLFSQESSILCRRSIG